ncbi:MAG: hypothetical protein ACREUC_24295, partial [Steroidobacteraceae bacterium]
MVQVRGSSAALYASFATVLAMLAGCSPLATAPEDQDEEIVDFVELDPSITKLDEADIGTSGP